MAAMRAKPALWPITVVYLLALGQPPSTFAQPAASASRTVHRFDFDEQAEGNLEDVPKYWDRLAMAGFPPFAKASFDLEQGHLAPPSFHLSSDGRNVAYSYVGPDTRIQPNSDYRVEGFVRPDQLRYARACVSALYLDQDRHPMLDTMVRTDFIGGDADETDRWERFELFLPAAPRGAQTIGLIVWVLQEPQWSMSARARRHISRNDVNGGAWFDDIQVFSLPRVLLETSEPSNVLSTEATQELRATVASQDGEHLMGRLSIFAADDELVETHTVPTITTGLAQAMRVPVDHLHPGLYRARLEVFDKGTLILTRSLRFARLADLSREKQVSAHSFGIVINPEARLDPAVELALLRNQVAKSVKLPIWSGLPSDPPTRTYQRAYDAFVSELVKDGFALTGVLAGPPGEIVRKDGPYPRSLIDLLSEDETVWQEYLAAVVAPNAGTFRWWQLGRDDRVPTASREELTTALARLRAAIKKFITAPLLSLAVSAFTEMPGGKLPIEQITLQVGHESVPQWIQQRVERLAGLGYDRLTTFIPPLPAEEYRSDERLADWVQRIVLARHAGAKTVFVPQTWRVRDTVHGQVSEPTQAYVVFRTLVDLLADSDPGERLDVGVGIQCLAFHEGDVSTLVIWDATAPAGGRTVPIQLGRATKVLDIWGDATDLKRGERGRHLVTLSPMPVFVGNVERWLVDLRGSMTIDPVHVESGQELQQHTIQLSHRGQFPIAGSIQFSPPKAWKISPRTIPFNLMPQRSLQLPIEINYPHNETAGIQRILANVTLPSPAYYMEIPLSVDVGLTDIDVWGMAFLEDGSLILRQVVTNRSGDTLHFRGTAAVPGRQRQYRPITNLQPGDTQAVEYQFSAGLGLVAQTVRVGLREMNDGPRTHSLTLVVP